MDMSVSDLVPQAAGLDEPGDPRGGASPVETALYGLLERHATSLVGGLDASASPVEASLLGALHLPSDRVLDQRGFERLFFPAEKPLIARLWGRACQGGISTALVDVRDTPSGGRHGQRRLYLFDLLHGLGAMIFVLLDQDDQDVQVTTGGIDEPMPGRRSTLVRMSRDAGSFIRWVDPGVAGILGWAPEELVGRRTLELIHPEDRLRGIAKWTEMLERPEREQASLIRWRTRDGYWAWVELINRNRLSDDEHHDIYSELSLCQGPDVRDPWQPGADLLERLTDTVPVGLLHVAVGGRVLFANRRICEMTGSYGAATVRQQLAGVVPEDWVSLEKALSAGESGSESDVEVRIRDDSGLLLNCTASVRPLSSKSGEVEEMTICLTDMTDMVRSQRELELKASSDPLTGCLNREATLSALQELLKGVGAGRGSSGTAVIFVDLDHFKDVNDDLGHAAGDEVLVRVTRGIRSSIRATDVLGRVGGDEFLVVCPGVPERSQALELASSLERRAFRHLLSGSPGPVIRASIGVAWSPPGATDASSLVEAADQAMYEAKRSASPRPVMAPDRLGP